MTEPVIEELPKKVLSEAKLEALAKAREKANVVRKANSEERKKQKEIEKAAIEKTKRENSNRIQREYETHHKESSTSCETLS